MSGQARDLGRSTISFAVGDRVLYNGTCEGVVDRVLGSGPALVIRGAAGGEYHRVPPELTLVEPPVDWEEAWRDA